MWCGWTSKKGSKHVVLLFFSIFTSKCASHHDAVHVCNISTSKSAPNPSVFNTFGFETCFAPQRRALLHHLNFQKWSKAGVFCTFSLRNVLRATTACNFSTSQLPKVVRICCVLYILAWKCASRRNGVHFCDISTSKSAQSLPRHSGVHFFISHLPRWLRTRRFSEPTFHPPEPQIILEKHSVSPLFYLLAHLHIFFLLTLSLLWSSFFFSSLTLPTSAFPSVHIVGNLTSKLPSIIWRFSCPHAWVKARPNALSGAPHIQRTVLKHVKQSNWL